MKVKVTVVGATTTPWVREAMDEYTSRLQRMIPFELCTIPDVRTSRATTPERQKDAEAVRILAAAPASETMILLDERGKEYTSRQFAEWLEQRMAAGATKALNFVIGGPYGFTDSMYARADHKIALSRMTFTHEMARLLLTEQIYRGLTILRGMPYHHD